MTSRKVSSSYTGPIKDQGTDPKIVKTLDYGKLKLLIKD